MLIQAEDGRFYRGATWVEKRRIIEIIDEPRLYYKGNVTWKTARYKLPIKAKLKNVEEMDFKIINGEFCNCSVFVLELTDKIPVPDNYINMAELWDDYYIWDGKKYVNIGIVLS